MTEALSLDAIAVNFGTMPGLADVTLTIANGERVVLLAPSGAGKTTLLRAIAGLEPVLSGCVSIGGRPVTNDPPESRGAVYLHQTPMLFPHLDVAANVAFPMRLRRVERDVTARRVAELLASVHMSELAGRKPGSLSGGQRHRVALARAMAAGPRMLLLDEPLASLDPGLRQEVRQVLARTQLDGTGMLIATHDLDDAVLLADRVAVLLGGRIAQVAPAAVLFRTPATLRVAAFLGIPNRINGRMERGVFHSALGQVPVRDTAPDGKTAAVFAADAVTVARSGERATVFGEVIEVHSHLRHPSIIVRCGTVALEALAPRPVPVPGTTVGLVIESSVIHLLPGGDDA
ncbi:MAG: ABC transporter ATP-binding protein [Gemmatimonadales bacterium]